MRFEIVLFCLTNLRKVTSSKILPIGKKKEKREERRRRRERKEGKEGGEGRLEALLDAAT